VEDSFYEELDCVPKYHMKILLGDFDAKVGMEDIFKPTIRNEIVHDINDDNGVMLVNFATSENLRVKSMMFPHCNIHRYTWTSSDGKTHNQIDHILVDRATMGYSNPASCKKRRKGKPVPGSITGPSCSWGIYS
jgi:hypothetical protein